MDDHCSINLAVMAFFRSAAVPSIQSKGLVPVSRASSLATSQEGRRFLLSTSEMYEGLSPVFSANSFCLNLAVVSMVREVRTE